MRQALLQQWLNLTFVPTPDGGNPGTTQDPAWLAAAALASPTRHVRAGVSPPIKIYHGAFDIQMPPLQSLELHGLYLRRGLTSTLTLVEGAGHCDNALFTEAKHAETLAYLKSALF